MSANKHAGHPGDYEVCKTCPISLVCLSGRKQLGQRWWCNNCRGTYYAELRTVVQCVVFRAPRGRHKTQMHGCVHCLPACAVDEPTRLVKGVTHRDVRKDEA